MLFFGGLIILNLNLTNHSAQLAMQWFFTGNLNMEAYPNNTITRFAKTFKGLRWNRIRKEKGSKWVSVFSDFADRSFFIEPFFRISRNSKISMSQALTDIFNFQLNCKEAGLREKGQKALVRNTVMDQNKTKYEMWDEPVKHLPVGGGKEQQKGLRRRHIGRASISHPLFKQPPINSVRNLQNKIISQGHLPKT